MSKIEISKISNGIFWLEIKEVKLKILCASPADAVKHMMKNSLMQSSFEDGFFIEDGPNAILLSDTMIQNGSFANLCEFPVLQMLYRQGLLVPNHPNNTGKKPLLIGSQEQVTAQFDYIFRGNYGLISREEIMECNVPKDIANELFNMKLKFAFGNISSASNLLDSIVIENKQVEIRDGVFIQRKRLNEFLIHYDGKECAIDLNLHSEEEYESPYALEYQNIYKENFAVIHSGEGDGWDIHRSTMSSVIIHDAKIYLIDAGPNLENILNALGIGLSEVEGIFHTHSHDDHFSGLTTLLKANRKIKYFTTSLVRLAVTKKLSALLGIQEEEFGRYFDVQDLENDVFNIIDGLEVMPIISPHPVETNIFYFRKKDKGTYKSYAHYADISSFKVLQSMLADKNEIGITQERYQQTLNEYLQYADIKKVDVGGGMIHGEVEDFADDTSGKIIFSHTSKPIKKEENSIGASTLFGSVDVLIRDDKNYDQLIAFEYLENYFSHLDTEDMDDLLACEVKTYPPGSTLLNKGEFPKFTYLILSGNVLVAKGLKNQISRIDSGTLIGDINMLNEEVFSNTYCAKSYVRALEIPAEYFITMVKKYKQLDKLEELHKLHLFLLSTWLFHDSNVYGVLKNLDAQIDEVNVNVGEKMCKNANESCLYILYQGKLQCTLAGIELETIEEGNFIGDNFAFNKPQFITINAVEDSILYKIPIEAIKDIPSLQWKLYETYKKRSTNILNNLPQNMEKIGLDETIKSNVNQIDKLHQTLIDTVNIFFSVHESKSEKERINALKNVFVHAKYHFQVEETLLIQYKHPNYREHRKEHKQFLKFLENALENIDEANLNEIATWIKSHFAKDKEMATYLISKGIF